MFSFLKLFKYKRELSYILRTRYGWSARWRLLIQKDWRGYKWTVKVDNEEYAKGTSPTEVFAEIDAADAIRLLEAAIVEN